MNDTAPGLKRIEYATSIAATWVWAPAIFVASSVACQYGMAGLLWFAIPNMVTLMLFGLIASKSTYNYHPTAGDAVFLTTNAQMNLHNAISMLLLVCSTFVQLLGIYYLVSAWFDAPRWLTGAAVLAFALVIVAKGGLRSCIRTDLIKYFVMLACGFTLLFNAPWEAQSVERSVDFWPFFLSFALPSTIGLLAAPYVDTTFWQRAKSLGGPRDVQDTFFQASLWFVLIPFIFGFIGIGHADGWSIQTAFSSTWLQVVLGVAVLAALVSTIDSNLCAAQAIIKFKGAAVAFSLMVLALFVTLTDLTIVDMFLFYGTARTVAAVPTILAVCGKADKTRLLYVTYAALLICPTGFVACKLLGYGEWAVLFTILAVLIPLFGFKK